MKNIKFILRGVPKIIEYYKLCFVLHLGKIASRFVINQSSFQSNELVHYGLTLVNWNVNWFQNIKDTRRGFDLVQSQIHKEPCEERTNSSIVNDLWV